MCLVELGAHHFDLSQRVPSTHRSCLHSLHFDKCSVGALTHSLDEWRQWQLKCRWSHQICSIHFSFHLWKQLESDEYGSLNMLNRIATLKSNRRMRCANKCFRSAMKKPVTFHHLQFNGGTLLSGLWWSMRIQSRNARFTLNCLLLIKPFTMVIKCSKIHHWLLSISNEVSGLMGG